MQSRLLLFGRCPQNGKSGMNTLRSAPAPRIAPASGGLGLTAKCVFPFRYKESSNPSISTRGEHLAARLGAWSRRKVSAVSRSIPGWAFPAGGYINERVVKRNAHAAISCRGHVVRGPGQLHAFDPKIPEELHKVLRLCGMGLDVIPEVRGRVLQPGVRPWIRKLRTKQPPGYGLHAGGAHKLESTPVIDDHFRTRGKRVCRGFHKRAWFQRFRMALPM